jgi:hypothetical protein
VGTTRLDQRHGLLCLLGSRGGLRGSRAVREVPCSCAECFPRRATGVIRATRTRPTPWSHRA